MPDDIPPNDRPAPRSPSPDSAPSVAAGAEPAEPGPTGHGRAASIVDAAPAAGPESTVGALPASTARGRRPKRAVFALTGRAAPGLYAAGWALSLLGLLPLGLLLASGPAPSLGVGVMLETGLLLLGLGLLAAAGAQALQRRADGMTGYWGPSPFLVFGAILTLTPALAFLLVTAPRRLLGLTNVDASALTLVELAIQAVVYVVLIQLVVVGPGALSWREIVRPTGLPARSRPPIGPDLGPPGSGPPSGRPDLLGDVIWGILLAIVSIVATAFIAGILAELLGIKNAQGPLPTPAGQLDRWLNLVSAAVAAPIGEEIFFRGFTTNAWARGMGVSRAIVRAGLFFAFVHVLDISGNDAGEALRLAILAFAARLPVSFALSWLYLRRRSIYASGALHASYNTLLVLLSWLEPVG